VECNGRTALLSPLNLDRRKPCREWEKSRTSERDRPGTTAAQRRAVLQIAFVCAAAAVAPAEPSLLEVQSAAARTAGGEVASDASRTARLRASHWAPVVRAQIVRRDDLRTRVGEYRGYPLRQDDAGAAHTWLVTLTWDFAHLVYAREESQLALAHVHLARVRREAAEKAASLWIERREKRASLRDLSGAARREAALDALRISAELDALTGGLYRDLVAREQAELEVEEP
jgi:hypothetical protein